MIKVIAILLVSIFAFSQAAFAGCGGCGGHEAVKSAGIINSTCPVMDSEVSKDTPYKVEYKGKTIGLCCAGCIDKFNEDPEGYLSKICKKCVINCPKCGAEIDLTQECKEGKTKGACPITGR